MSVAVVTGANRIPGIGYEIARGLAHRLPEGSSVVLTARVPEMGQKAIESLKTEVGERVKAGVRLKHCSFILVSFFLCHIIPVIPKLYMQVSLSDCFLYNVPVALLQVLFHQLDISDAKSVEDLRDFISKELGGIDLLVNNAGMAFPLSDPTPFKEQARRTVDSWWHFPSQAHGCSHKKS